MSISDLSRFQVDVLSVLADGPRSGSDIADVLEGQYGREVSSSRLYQNLGELGGDGLVNVDERAVDGRTHRFHLTNEGRMTIERYAETLRARVSKVPGPYER